LSHHEADNIRKRLITHKNELFAFLKYPAIEPTNNRAETGIRNSVLFRKITFGNRTAQGKKNVSSAMTIIRTAKLRLLPQSHQNIAVYHDWRRHARTP
jgi:hypothetical protein